MKIENKQDSSATYSDAPMPVDGWFCELGQCHWVELALEKDGEQAGHYTNTCDNRAWLLTRNEVNHVVSLRDACFNCIKLLQASTRSKAMTLRDTLHFE